MITPKLEPLGPDELAEILAETAWLDLPWKRRGRLTRDDHETWRECRS
jgi:hypothetical protein